MRLDGAKVKQLRHGADLTQEQLAVRAGWDCKTVQRAERGESISGGAARDISSALRIPLVHLVLEIADRDGIFVRFARLQEGRSLLNLLSAGDLRSTDAEPASGEVGDLIRDLLSVWDWCDLWSELSEVERYDAALAVHATLKALMAHGWEVLVTSRPVTFAGVANMTLNILKIQEGHPETALFSTAAVAAAEPAVMDDIVDRAREMGTDDRQVLLVREFYRMLAPKGPLVRRATALGIRAEVFLRLVCSLPADPIERTHRIADEATRWQIDATRLAEAVGGLLADAPLPTVAVH